MGESNERGAFRKEGEPSPHWPAGQSGPAACRWSVHRRNRLASFAEFVVGVVLLERFLLASAIGDRREVELRSAQGLGTLDTDARLRHDLDPFGRDFCLAADAQSLLVSHLLSSRVCVA